MAKQKFTAEQINGMTFPNLVKAAQEMGVPFNGEKKDALKDKLLQSLDKSGDEEKDDVDPTEATKQAQLNEFVQALLKPIASLKDAGVDPKQIRDDEDVTTIFEEFMNRDDAAFDGEDLEKTYEKVLSGELPGEVAEKPKKTAKKATAKNNAGENKEKPKKEKKEKEPLVITDEQQAIIDNKTYSKSDKIRLLYDAQMTHIGISKTLNAHYSFVHGVINRYKEEKKAAKETGAEVSAVRIKAEKKEKPKKEKKGKKSADDDVVDTAGAEVTEPTTPEPTEKPKKKAAAKKAAAKKK